MRLFSFTFFFIFSTITWGSPVGFQGRVDFSRDLASFESEPPVAGTLYLLTGSAASIRIVSEDPFVAEIDFVQGEWKSEADLIAHKVVLRFEGADWAKLVVAKKPRQNSDAMIYPYRKSQAAAVPVGALFKVIAVPLMF